MSHQFRTLASRGNPAPLGEPVPAGKYGKMFPSLPPLYVDEAKLIALGDAMKEAAGDPPADNGIPAGYTFLGQFIDHDVTYDPTSLSESRVDPLALTNYRTPSLALDNLYGRGPDIDPHYYMLRLPGSFDQPAYFQTGNTVKVQQGHHPDSMPFDLQRAEQSRMAVIPDPRNDENLIVAQLHVAMQLFHNAVADQLSARKIAPASAMSAPPRGDEVFHAVREIVLLYYHGIVLEEFLPQILDAGVLGKVLAQGSLLYRGPGEPYIPVEFSAAAYRFGHGTIRDNYEYNSVFSTGGTTGQPASLDVLFREAAGSRGPIDLPLLVSDWIIDWRRFIPGLGDPALLNLSRNIGPTIATALGNLPGMPNPANLATRNLMRGNSMRLPSGQSVANYFGYQPLSPEEIGRGRDGAVATQMGLDRETPLWYYILKEAEQRCAGRNLGEVGSRIIAEVFVGLLERDSASLIQRKSTLSHTLAGKAPGEFRMADLLQFAGFVNPLDGPV